MLYCVSLSVCTPHLSFFLSRLNKQTLLSRSLYSCVDFCVCVCFNLNGFQVPPLPNNSLPVLFFDLADIEACSPPTHPPTPIFFSLSLNPRETLHCTITHFSLPPLLFPPVSPFFSPLQTDSWAHCIAWRPVLPPAFISCVGGVTVAASPHWLMGSDLHRSVMSGIKSQQPISISGR